MTTATQRTSLFVWFEHESRDPKRAQRFYADVLGWDVSPFPMGDSTYEMIRPPGTEDAFVGGYVETPSSETAQWLSYVLVDDVDRSAKEITKRGGRVLEAPHDIPTVGRSARIADPQGAQIHLFRPTESDRSEPPASEGRFFWNELRTSDPEKAVAFYESLLGATHETMHSGSEKYHVLSKGGAGRAGVTKSSPGEPPHWLPYVFTKDVDATAAKAAKSGGRVWVPPKDIPDIGRFAVLSDPLGAPFAIMTPRPM